jgi:formylglycine-generating enzyme required for sulfatase activity
MGKFIYAAPECMESPDEADARCDVYSLGMTAVFALAGRRLSHAALYDRMKLIGRLSCSDAVKAALTRATAPEAGERYGRMADFCAALREAIAKPLPTPPHRPAPEPEPEGARDVRFTCTGCRATLRTTDRLAGRLFRCPKCGIVVSVPSAPPAPGGQEQVFHLAQTAAVAWRSLQEKGEDEQRKAIDAAAAASTDEAREMAQQIAQHLAPVPAEARDSMRRTEDASGLPREFTNSIGMRFVLVQPGRFLIGSPEDEAGRFEDETQHEVTITEAFYLGVHQVTQGQWKRVMGNNPSWFSRFGGGKYSVRDVGDAELDLFPVESVSWEDAQAFLKKLAALPEEAKQRREFRLPSEAEWEYACRGGPDWSPLPFHVDQPASSLPSSQANFNGSYPYGGATEGPALLRTCRVGSYRPNRLGLYDMHGNVCEWCNDCYDVNDAAPGRPRRVARGGGWSVFGRDCRAASRDLYAPSDSPINLGFRAAAVLRQ